MEDMSLYQEVIHRSRYARWDDKNNRREDWDETVSRYFNWFSAHLEKNHKYKLTKELRKALEVSMINMEIQPSMRTLMTAGKALEFLHGVELQLCRRSDGFRSVLRRAYVRLDERGGIGIFGRETIRQ